MASNRFRMIEFRYSGAEWLEKSSTRLWEEMGRSEAQKDKKLIRRLLRAIEFKANKMLGGKLIQGGIGRSKVPVDIALPPNSPLLSYLKKDVEFKAAAGPSAGAKVGQFTVGAERAGTPRQVVLPGDRGTTTTLALKKSALREETTVSDFSGNLIDIDPFFTDARGNPINRNYSSVTNRVFNTYFKRSRNLRYLFYAKANTMLLNNFFTSKGVSQVRFIGLSFPISRFNSKFFKAEIERGAIVISINDNFQRQIFNFFNAAILESNTELSRNPIRKTLTINGKRVSIDVASVPLDGSNTQGFEITRSLAVRPNDSFRVKVKGGKKGGNEQQRFISGAQLTTMLQKLMRQKMPQGPRRGPPLSDDVLTERTGRFRRSTVAVPNYRKNMIRFMYDPIYKTFIGTPRNPDELIERSLREIVQTLFSRQFKIVRGF